MAAIERLGRDSPFSLQVEKKIGCAHTAVSQPRERRSNAAIRRAIRNLDFCPLPRHLHPRNRVGRSKYLHGSHYEQGSNDSVSIGQPRRKLHQVWRFRRIIAADLEASGMLAGTLSSNRISEAWIMVKGQVRPICPAYAYCKHRQGGHDHETKNCHAHRRIPVTVKH